MDKQRLERVLRRLLLQLWRERTLQQWARGSLAVACAPEQCQVAALPTHRHIQQDHLQATLLTY